jgi:hypothetical protein
VGHFTIYVLIKSDPGFREEPKDELNINSPKPFWSGNESHVSYAQAAQHSTCNITIYDRIPHRIVKLEKQKKKKKIHKKKKGLEAESSPLPVGLEE